MAREGEPAGSAWEVAWVFLRLGLRCFGGPIAHLGYFREEFVVRRRWLDERAYADLVGLCQFLPGPASSQVGFAIGLGRAGLGGGLAAWAGFTLPSALALLLFAQGAWVLGATSGLGVLSSLGVLPSLGVLHGLKLVAVAVVAQAVWSMARTLCPDRGRASVAVAATLLVLLGGAPLAPVGAIALGALLGVFLNALQGAAAAGSWLGGPHQGDDPQGGGEGAGVSPVSRRGGLAALAVFCVLLLGLPVLGRWTGASAVSLFGAFYRAGALVFGGGHVVLPLLRGALVGAAGPAGVGGPVGGWITDSTFLAGYGAAQAVPGPLFSVAAYLGARAGGGPGMPGGLAGAALGLVGLFLPGLLIVLAALPFWAGLRHRPVVQAMARGVNAAVVGLLGATLYDPLWTGTVRTPGDFALALSGFVALAAWRAPPLLVVVFCVGGGLLGL